VPKCVAVLSGGPDSFCYAVQWKARNYDIYPIIFDYGQKGAREIDVACELSEKAGFKEPLVVDVSSLKKVWRGTQLTDHSVRVEAEYTPTVVVPIRNVVFLAIASAYALSIRADVVIYGAHLSDTRNRSDVREPMYPDCTPATAEALERVIDVAHSPVGMRKVSIWSPAREGLTKSQNLLKGYRIVGDLVYETWSCYLSGEVHCGECESCRNRHAAFIEAGLPDKTIYKVHPIVSDLCREGRCGAPGLAPTPPVPLTSLTEQVLPAEVVPVVPAGRKLSEQAKQKLREKMKQKWQDPEYRKKVTEAIRQAYKEKRGQSK
jgi:7-cyano-7-deazaguanine synthase